MESPAMEMGVYGTIQEIGFGVSVLPDAYIQALTLASMNLPPFYS